MLVEVKEEGVVNPTKYQYDPNGNLVKKIMSDISETKYEYNALNQMKKETRPDGKFIKYSYDQVGNLLSKVNRLGVKEEYGYYKNNNLAQIRYYDNETTRVAKGLVDYQYDQAGNRTSVDNGVSVTQQKHDQLGRVVEEARSIGTASYVTKYKYDMYGNLTGVKYPKSSNYLEYSYDSFGQLNHIEGIAGTNVQSAFEYDLNGNITNISYKNGVGTAFTYDNVGRPKSIITNRPNLQGVGNEELLNLTYEYDKAGNVIKRNGNTYKYDTLNRLTKATIVGNFSGNSKGTLGRALEDYQGSGALSFGDDQDVIKLDYGVGSVGINFNKVLNNINKFELKTSGVANHRLSKRALEVYYSNTNGGYQKLAESSWDYKKDETNGNIVISIPQGISAQYLKVHSKFDDRDENFEIVDKGNFSNTLKDMLQVYSSENQLSITYEYDSMGNRTSKKTDGPGGIEAISYTYYKGTNHQGMNRLFSMGVV